MAPVLHSIAYNNPEQHRHARKLKPSAVFYPRNALQLEKAPHNTPDWETSHN
jgi:hypothetical protein